MPTSGTSRAATLRAACNNVPSPPIATTRSALVGDLALVDVRRAGEGCAPDPTVTEARTVMPRLRRCERTCSAGSVTLVLAEAPPQRDRLEFTRHWLAFLTVAGNPLLACWSLKSGLYVITAWAYGERQT